jgi:hypothetical protein
LTTICSLFLNERRGRFLARPIGPISFSFFADRPVRAVTGALQKPSLGPT